MIDVSRQTVPCVRRLLSLSPHAMSSLPRLFVQAVVLATASPLAAADAPRETGVWQEHRVTVSQLGFTVTYSCEGLRDKLEALLRAAGAREDIEAVPLACGAPGRPNPAARVELRFFTLAPATSPDAIAGTWRQVRIRPGRPRELSRGDCELVERFRNDLLPAFTTREVQDRVRCIPHQPFSTVDLRFRVFAPAPADRAETK